MAALLCQSVNSGSFLTLSLFLRSLQDPASQTRRMFLSTQLPPGPPLPASCSARVQTIVWTVPKAAGPGKEGQVPGTHRKKTTTATPRLLQVRWLLGWTLGVTGLPRPLKRSRQRTQWRQERRAPGGRVQPRRQGRRLPWRRAFLMPLPAR